MKDYNYLEAEIEDVKEYLKNNYTIKELKEENIEKLQERLSDELWMNDSVTGNASGSYTCNTWQAEENISHNMDLLQEALESFGEESIDFLSRGAEWADVTIRCYLLGQAIEEAIGEILEEVED